MESDNLSELVKKEIMCLASVKNDSLSFSRILVQDIYSFRQLSVNTSDILNLTLN